MFAVTFHCMVEGDTFCQQHYDRQEGGAEQQLFFFITTFYTKQHGLLIYLNTDLLSFNLTTNLCIIIKIRTASKLCVKQVTI